MPFKEIENHFEHNVVSVRRLPVVFIVILRRLWQCRNRLSLCLLPWLLDSLSLLPLGLTQVQCISELSLLQPRSVIVLVPPGRPNGNAALAPATPSAPPNNRLPARFFLSFGQELKSLKLRRLIDCLPRSAKTVATEENRHRPQYRLSRLNCPPPPPPPRPRSDIYIYIYVSSQLQFYLVLVYAGGFYRLTVQCLVSPSFVLSLTKEITPKICRLCFTVLINQVAFF